jgi:hypothetical protein
VPINLPEILGRIKLDTSDLAKGAKDVDKNISGISDNAKKNFAIVGTAMVAAGAVLTREGKRIEDSNIRLRNTVENVGGSYKALKPEIDAAVQTQQRYGHTISESQNVLSGFALRLKDPAKAMEALSLASDVAAAKGISLSEAAALVGKVYAGNTKALKQFGVDLTDSKAALESGQKATDAYTKANNNLKEAQEALSAVQERIKAQGFSSGDDQRELAKAYDNVATAQLEVAKTATGVQNTSKATSEAQKDLAGAIDQVKASVKGVNEELASTFTGRLKAIKVEIQDAIGLIGGKLGPVITGVGAAFTALSGVTTVLDSNLIAITRTKVAETFASIKASAAEAGIAATALKVALVGLATVAGLVALALVISEITKKLQEAKAASAEMAQEIIKGASSPTAALQGLEAQLTKQKAALEANRKEYSLFGIDLSFVSGKTGQLKGAIDETTKAHESQKEVLAAAAQKRKDDLATIEAAVGSEAAATARAAGLTNAALGEAAQASAAFKDAMQQSFAAATSAVQKFGSDSAVTKEQLLKFYADQVAAARDWSKNLIELAKSTLDKGLIQELAALGPKAAPLIAAYLDAVRSGNAAVFNKTIADLKHIETETTKEVGRAAEVINNTKPKIQIDNAQAIAAIAAVAGAMAGIRNKEVTITTHRKWGAQEGFGSSHEGGLVRHQGGSVEKMHSGGLRSDERLALLQTGEYVFRRTAVQALGLNNLQRMNAAGGRGIPAARDGGGNTYNVNVSIPETWTAMDRGVPRTLAVKIRDTLIDLDQEQS